MKNISNINPSYSKVPLKKGLTAFDGDKIRTSCTD